MKKSPGKKLDNSSHISFNGLENNKSTMMAQTIAPKKGHQADNYQGPVDPFTRLRHGQGVYSYPNKYFTYEGNYVQGVKQGKGNLKFSDGRIIKGNFENGELNGEAEICYSDGSLYKGQLKNGQKSGFGIYKSLLETYEGQFQENKRQGKGSLITSTANIKGQFKDNKAHGKVTITKYNYVYEGSCAKGLKHGKGYEVSKYNSDNYEYNGQFQNDKYHGQGIYKRHGNLDGYQYEGLFKNGKPQLYPNQFKVLLGSSVGAESQNPSNEGYQVISGEQNIGTPIEYQLQGENQLYFKFESAYQAPEKIDPNQPTEEEIQKLVKDWQNENKKNKNPPPMPDFRQPKMIKPPQIIVHQESQRLVQIKLAKADGSDFFKIDYREEIKKKRAQNEVLKAEAIKKAEEEGNKKGGKGPGKVEAEFKVNVFCEKYKTKDQCLSIKNTKGKAEVQKFQLPDDFPPGTYQLIVSSPFNLFGDIKQVKKTINIKSKNAAVKKK